MITRNTVVVGVPPRINNIKFGEVLLAANSPAFGDSYQIYDAIVREKVDPAFLLALFGMESAYGTQGYAVNFHNPGNTRSTLNKNGTLQPTPKGTFVDYPNWFEGFKDLAVRLVEPDYIYGRNYYVTISQIIPVFAPKSDSNDPENYINVVVEKMNSWIGTTSGGSSVFDLNNIPFFQSPNYDDLPNSDQLIIIHLTMGSFASSKPWLLSKASGASAHYIISEDASQAAQLVADNRVAWHSGNYAYNEKGIGVELCWGFAGHDGPIPDNLYRADARLVAMLCRRHNIQPNRGHIIGHNEVPDPDNPDLMGGIDHHTDPGVYWDWNKFMAYVTQYYLGGATVSDFPNPPDIPPGPVPEFDPNPNKFNVGFGMIDFARSRTLTFITNEQYFSPNAGQPGLGQMSRAWVQDAAGVTYILMASEQPELAAGGIAPWKVEQYELKP